MTTMYLILGSLLFLFQLGPSSAYLPPALRDYCNRTYGNYTINSPYRQNLETVLFNIYSDTKITTGFYNFSYGEPPDTVYAIALCRGDLTLAGCHRWLNFTSTKLLSTCSNEKQAIRWYAYCMVRYSDQPMFGVMDTSPLYAFTSEQKVLNPSDFDRGVLEFLRILVRKTAAGNSTLKFAMEKTNVTPNQTVYAFTQCTPDLSQSACNTCLSIALSDLPNCCLPYNGLTYFRPSCNLRYETKKFTGTFETLQGSLPPNPGKMKTITMIAIVVTMIAGCLLLGAYLLVRRYRGEWKKADHNVMDKEHDTNGYETLQIPYCDIMEATQGFAEANKIGRGGFGTVYKGMLASGQEIAVKRLARNSLQGETEFRTEMLLVVKLQHRNLVRLLGYSLEGVERLLIYEFVPNGSLDLFLFGKTKRVSLDWPIRHNIIGGIARGILYLHEDSRIRIVHRDLKASNILLDANFDPKIADFGMARLFKVDQTHIDTIRIAGTFGYMAPEYVYRGIFSNKSDVYSFGVLVLEIICGRKNFGNSESDNMEDLITIVWRNWRERTTLKVVDSALVSSSTTQIIRCIQICLLCVQEDPVNRPTMFSINMMLNSESQSIPFPSDPGYELHRSIAVDLQFPNTMK